MKKHLKKKKQKSEVVLVSPEETISALATTSVLELAKQMRNEIASLPTPAEKIKAQREFIASMMDTVPQVRRKAPILVIHTADQIMADIAAIGKQEDRVKELKELLKLYSSFIVQPKPL